MNSVIILAISFIGYLLAYKLYGRYIGKKVFKIVSGNKMPSHEFNDGVDYVPTKPNIIFGHHFTTIAGLGPIVGPAIGIIWGWLPAFLWVILGSIFMGAVHDFTTLIVSARNKGKTIGELTGQIINPSTRFAFQFIMQLLLFIVLSVFAMIVSTLFIMYPESVIPVWFQIPVAMVLGWQIRKGRNDLLFSILALLIMYASIYLGMIFPLDMMQLPFIQAMEDPVQARNLATVIWCVILFVYVFFASTLPVQILLQPRDYINSHQLLVAVALLVIGLVVAHPVITAPAINDAAFSKSSDVPAMMPLLFIIIACGAISGFHSIASSGTTVKQVDKEEHTLPIGYGGMLLEGFLAILVMVAIAAGLGMGLEKEGVLYKGGEAFRHHYSSWAATNNSGIGAKLESFIVGAANLFNAIGIPKSFGIPMIAVFIVSFANTTLDSAARIQRLSLQEIFTKKDGTVSRPINNRFVSTALVVLMAAVMSFIKPGGKGALMLWPLFGSLNQLLAALALGIVSMFIITRLKPVHSLLTLLPMVFVLFMTIWAMVENIIRFLDKNEFVPLVLSLVVLVLTIWLMISGLRAIGKVNEKRKSIKKPV